MTPKGRKTIRICLAILAVSMVVMVVSTIMQISHNGWDSTNTITLVPFLCSGAVMIALLKRDDK